MAADKLTETLIEALKLALSRPIEQRLFKSGKLDGLFAGRTGVNGDAAALAVRDGLLEVVRTETKGKTTIDWVQLTSRGVSFLHDRESPVRALDELRIGLQAAKEGVPVWLAEVRESLRVLEARLTEDVQKMMNRLEGLSRRVEETLRRLEENGPVLPDGALTTTFWAADALAYLDRRKVASGAAQCPLPELFTALAEQRGDLSITAFHDGLRRLQDQRVIRLLPFAGPPDELPQPEYALLDGATFMYYAAR